MWVRLSLRNGQYFLTNFLLPSIPAFYLTWNIRFSQWTLQYQRLLCESSFILCALGHSIFRCLLNITCFREYLSISVGHCISPANRDSRSQLYGLFRAGSCMLLGSPMDLTLTYCTSVAPLPPTNNNKKKCLWILATLALVEKEWSPPLSLHIPKLPEFTSLVDPRET